jgi:ATP-binding protein involved in chromosome partitioning
MGLRRTPIPAGVDLDDGGKTITVRWADGTTNVYRSYDLRIWCPCASCVDEFTGKRLLDPDRVDPEVAAVQWTRVGRYALQIQWSDGHDTGIYTYERLREGFTTTNP